jgi:signal transduction histidine kinase
MPIAAAASKMVDFPISAQPAASPSPLEPRPRLVLRFALYAGAVLLVAGLAIAWLVDREVANRAQRTIESQARAVVAENLRSHLRSNDFNTVPSARRRAALDDLFRKSILLPGVVDGRLISRSGTITYAARHALIGTKLQNRTELVRALDGSTTRQVARITTWRGQKDLKVLRVIVPVRLKGQGRSIGAVELDQDYRAAAVGIGDAQRRLALILALALLALYLALFPILRRVTRQLQAHNERLREYAAAERSANTRLLELDALKDEFISLVSHELRTPLTSIRGYVELLLEEKTLDDEQRRFLAVVDRNSARLLDLVADLLFLAQVDAGKLALELGPVDLKALAGECVESSLPDAAAKGIDLTSSAEPVPMVRGDRTRLAQVLDNLISNALKFTPAGGHVDVRVRATNGAAVLEVQDTGLGLAEDERERLFERFFRSARATESAIQGTGLGLPIAKAIVERHGGRIDLESTLESGTTVRVELPLSQHGVQRSTQEIAA